MLILITEVLSNADIGTHIHLNAGTVKDHGSLILTKLRVSSRA
ncbi:LuxR C-terminal-related transcriptional regulator [Streptomyces citrinus]